MLTDFLIFFTVLSIGAAHESLVPTVKLSNGKRMPVIGFGTYLVSFNLIAFNVIN